MKRFRIFALTVLCVIAGLGCAHERTVNGPTLLDPGPVAPGRQADSLSVNDAELRYIATAPRFVNGNEFLSHLTVFQPVRASSGGYLHEKWLHGSGGDIFEIQYRGEAGGLLWRQVYDFTKVLSDSTVSILEQSPKDSLRISRTLMDGVISETYSFNDGPTHFYSWPVGSAPAAEIVAAFRDAYPTLGTLGDCADGKVAVSIATSESYNAWRQRIASGSAEKAGGIGRPLKVQYPPWLDRACRIIGVACALKCQFFPANPVCVACVGVTIVCFLLYIFGG